MKRLEFKSWLGLLMVSVLLILVKLFTFCTVFPDDSTTGIAIRSHPSLQNTIGADSCEAQPLMLVGPDESFVGQALYRFVVSTAWLLVPGVVLLCFCGRVTLQSGLHGLMQAKRGR